MNEQIIGGQNPQQAQPRPVAISADELINSFIASCMQGMAIKVFVEVFNKQEALGIMEEIYQDHANAIFPQYDRLFSGDIASLGKIKEEIRNAYNAFMNSVREQYKDEAENTEE